MVTPIHMKGSDQSAKAKTSQVGTTRSVASRHTSDGMK
jgi:hypothetical protein